MMTSCAGIKEIPVQTVEKVVYRDGLGKIKNPSKSLFGKIMIWILSILMAGKTLANLYNSGLKDALLVHLSKESNFPELAYQTVLDELIANNYDENSLSLSVASRDVHSKLIQL